MPEEFWREVVDRVAAEAPDTLLLAEAFWLMEGYFVRTLGMHRVYNSAFMNMLRDEDNAKYRQVIKNTLEFDPEILKRYVNFMNNPDERTAVEQFGKGDKYFGVCTLMATLPGLPMFGHGQVEGFAEKYGMEYRRAYWDEPPEPWLVERHEREIFPLLHRRAPVRRGRRLPALRLLHSPTAASTRTSSPTRTGAGDERALVVYHNRYAETARLDPDVGRLRGEGRGNGDEQGRWSRRRSAGRAGAARRSRGLGRLPGPYLGARVHPQRPGALREGALPGAPRLRVPCVPRISGPSWTMPAFTPSWRRICREAACRASKRRPSISGRSPSGGRSASSSTPGSSIG